MVTMSRLDLSANACHCLKAEPPSQGDLSSAVVIQQLRCIVRKLPSKRKFNSCTASVSAPRAPVSTLASAVGAHSTAFPSLLTPHGGSVMVVGDAVGSSFL